VRDREAQRLSLFDSIPADASGVDFQPLGEEGSFGDAKTHITFDECSPERQRQMEDATWPAP